MTTSSSIRLIALTVIFHLLGAILDYQKFDCKTNFLSYILVFFDILVFGLMFLYNKISYNLDALSSNYLLFYKGGSTFEGALLTVSIICSLIPRSSQEFKHFSEASRFKYVPLFILLFEPSNCRHF